MTIQKAAEILGISANTTSNEIKKQYRKLMHKVHPDAVAAKKKESRYPYSAQEINAAYEVLLNAVIDIADDGRSVARNGAKRSAKGTGKNSRTKTKKEETTWNAPINETAFAKREILHAVEDDDGRVVGDFCITKGKFFWSADEDFSLFQKSLYRCSKGILDRIDEACNRSVADDDRIYVLGELTYYLASQFISGNETLKRLAKSEDTENGTIYYIPSMLEADDSYQYGTYQKMKTGRKLQPGEPLFPERVREHKLYLKDCKSERAGYLSFEDDRMYYVVIPLFENRQVQIKVEVADEKKHGNNDARNRKRIIGKQYTYLNVWIRFREEENTMPDSTNLKIEELLKRYREQF